MSKETVITLPITLKQEVRVASLHRERHRMLVDPVSASE